MSSCRPCEESMREWRVTSAVDLVARHLSTTSRCTFEDGFSEVKPC